MADYLIIEGALGEIAFSALEPRDDDAALPAVATAVALAVSPGVSGGIALSEPAVATATASAVSPDIAGGIEATIPAAAFMTATAISPATLPSVQTRAAVKAVFGFEPNAIADEWEQEPRIAGQFGTN